jgi:hypothetical protein
MPSILRLLLIILLLNKNLPENFEVLSEDGRTPKQQFV